MEVGDWSHIGCCSKPQCMYKDYSSHFVCINLHVSVTMVAGMYVHINFCMSEERQSYSVYFKDIYYVKFTKQFVGHMASFTSHSDW